MLVHMYAAPSHCCWFCMHHQGKGTWCLVSAAIDDRLDYLTPHLQLLLGQLALVIEVGINMLDHM
jgi:hypothetical protein